MSEHPTMVWPVLSYRDARAAITFLIEAFGFEERAVYARPDDPSVIEHAELGWSRGGGVMFGTAGKDTSAFGARKPGNDSVYVVCDDPDGLFARATAAGARVVRGLVDEDYGSRGFTVRDPEGNLWSFGTYKGAWVFDHVNIGVADLERSRAFYGRALDPLGISFVMTNQAGVGFGRDGRPQFWISGRTPSRPVHICFASPDRAAVDLFYHEALAAGGRDNGPPGLRPEYHPSYYGAFVLDPDGNNIEAVTHVLDWAAVTNPAAISAQSLRTMMWPQLSVRRGREAIDFYKAAFGAIEVYRVGWTDEHEEVVARVRAMCSVDP